MPHLMAAPIILPMVAAGIMLLYRGRSPNFNLIINLVSCAMLVVVATALLIWTKTHNPTAFGIYLPANWDMPFGIVLVLDRLSALMIALTSLLGLVALIYAIARWHGAGVYFHPLFQIQLMGINGAFLTADLFNLFVFFEIMLAASYGLLLHGSGPRRVLAGMHYVAINLVASSLFLIGAALIYGVTGTLNMADLAVKIPQIAAADRALLHAGLAILGIAFLTKAAAWPLNFWLGPAYSSASAPSAALFAVLTKIGIYVILRLGSLWLGPAAVDSAGFGQTWILWAGMITLVFGSIGMFVSQRPSRLAAYSIVLSAGILLVVISFGHVAVTSAGLYYLLISTLAVAALFLLSELIERSREPDPTTLLPPEDELDHLSYRLSELDFEEGVNRDDDDTVLVGRIIPAATGFLGISFILCALLIIGLPPLGGFIGKFAILSTMLKTETPVSLQSWMFLGLLIGSSLLALTVFSRQGTRFFWAPENRPAPRLSAFECLPVIALIVICAILTVRAESVMKYTTITAQAIYTPSRYIQAVLSAQPIDYPTRHQRESEP